MLCKEEENLKLNTIMKKITFSRFRNIGNSFQDSGSA